MLIEFTVTALAIVFAAKVLKSVSTIPESSANILSNPLKFACSKVKLLDVILVSAEFNSDFVLILT